MASKKNINLPAGFRAAGVKCGLKARGQRDLAVVAAEKDCAAAVLTTSNQVVGAPVIRSRRIMPRGYGKARAVIVNAGNANVCTGKRGLRDADSMAKLLAGQIDADDEKVLVASTGIIGHYLPIDKIRSGIKEASRSLSTNGVNDAAQAIMTTDTKPKSAAEKIRIAGIDINIYGIAKGAGMIAPSLATMIAVITTDAAVTPAALHKMLAAAAEVSFNAVTVDSDTSTSDMVIAMASGAAGNRRLSAGKPGYKKFAAALRHVCTSLARQIAADGEGATRLVEMTVKGARSDADAKSAAKSVTNSPLVKCAIHGRDPNWGRIAASVGKSSAKVNPDKLAIRIGGQLVFSAGRPRKFDVKKASKHLAGKEVKIVCDLKLGRASYTALTCDLSAEYIAINAEYHT